MSKQDTVDLGAVATEELFHYGVKGMKWGVRRTDAQLEAARAPQPVSVTQKKPGTFAKTSGGQNQPVSDDAAKALAARQKARASTTDSLSNAELRVAVERMNLEQQYSRLSFESDRRSKGVRFVAGFLGKPRYNGEKRRYVDDFETQGSRSRQVANVVGKELAKKAVGA